MASNGQLREHSCLACKFEMKRDANAALNILSRDFEKYKKDWDSLTERPQSYTATLICERELHSGERPRRLCSVCSPPRIRSMPWVESASSKEETLPDRYRING